MFSIGILGFLVWSYMMALQFCEELVINLAICWNSSKSWNTVNWSKNFHRWTQSAGNLYYIVIAKIITNKVSSETTRKTSFNFTSFHQIRSHFYTNLPIIENQWLEWFIGFTEGDGSIITSIKAKQPRLRFVITQKEKEILYHIQDILGFGYVRHIEKGNYYRYFVEDNKHIYILCHLFNGNLVIEHRKNQLEKWILFINSIIEKETSYIQTRHNITTKININNSIYNISLKDAWLSGFSDAEGNFTCEIKTYKYKSNCNIRFILDQNKEIILLNFISNLFLSGTIYKRKETLCAYRLQIRSIKSIKVIYDYFTKFKLKTIKKYSFDKWCVIYTIIINKEHLTKEGIDKILILSKNININNAQNKAIGKAKVLLKDEDIVQQYYVFLL